MRVSQHGRQLKPRAAGQASSVAAASPRWRCRLRGLAPFLRFPALSDSAFNFCTLGTTTLAAPHHTRSRQPVPVSSPRIAIARKRRAPKPVAVPAHTRVGGNARPGNPSRPCRRRGTHECGCGSRRCGDQVTHPWGPVACVGGVATRVWRQCRTRLNKRYLAGLGTPSSAAALSPTRQALRQVDLPGTLGARKRVAPVPRHPTSSRGVPGDAVTP